MPDAKPQAAVRAEDSVLALLVRRAAENDTAAFAQLYDLTCTQAYGLALRVCRDRGYAEEVLQEAYVQIWQTAAAYDPARGSVAAWVMTVVHRRAVDRVRSEVAGARRTLRYAVANMDPPPAGPADLVTALESRREVRDCLAGLTEVQRATIVLAYFGGLAYPEVAKHLKVGLPAVKSRIRDGMRRLRACLEVNGHG